MAKEALYTLLENEKVIFELNITDAMRTDAATAVAGMLKAIIPGRGDGNKGGVGVFVVTNMRCFVALQRKSGCLCCFSHEERFFWSFPLKALNGSNGYNSSQGAICLCCCKSANFSIDIGMTCGTSTFNVSVYPTNIKNHEQAQSIVAKLAELAQKSNQ